MRFAPADFPRQATARTQEAESTSLNFPKLSPGQTIPLSEAEGPEAV